MFPQKAITHPLRDSHALPKAQSFLSQPWCPDQKRICLTSKHNPGFESKPAPAGTSHNTHQEPPLPRCPTPGCHLCHRSSLWPGPGLTHRDTTYKQALRPDFLWRLGSSVAQKAPGNSLTHPPSITPKHNEALFSKGSSLLRG